MFSSFNVVTRHNRCFISILSFMKLKLLSIASGSNQYQFQAQRTKMIRTSGYRIKCLSFSSHLGNRRLSAQPAVSFKISEEEYANAIPYDEIPGLTKFDVLRRFVPGGKYHKMEVIDMQKSLRQEFGDFYRMPGMFGQNNLVTTFDPNDVEYIHRTEGSYPFRRGMETLNHFRKNIRSDVYSVTGLIVAQGDDWHKMRSAVNPILMQPKTVKSYIPTIDSIVCEFLENLPSIQDDKGEMPANFNEYLNRWSLESIVTVALEKRLGLMDFKNNSEIGEKITKNVRLIFSLGMDFEFKPSIWRVYETKEFKELMEAFNVVTDFSLMLVEEAKSKYTNQTSISSEQEEGILSKLLKKDINFATVMALDMIFAGIDTTSSALSFSMYCLAKHPEKQEKLRNELIEAMPDKNASFTAETMKNLPYLRAVLKESLRLFPPALGNMRRASDNLVIKGYQIPKGVDIMMGMLHMHRDTSNFESPDEFIPERWLRNQEVEACPQSLKQTHPFSYLPFGYGVRFCVGKRIAEMELEVFISRVIRNYKIEWHHPDLKIRATLVNIPDGELKFKMIKL